jgi:hypothetical protein
MSLIYYRSPPNNLGNRPEQGQALGASSLKPEEAAKSRISPNLSFEEILKNRTLSVSGRVSHLHLFALERVLDKGTTNTYVVAMLPQ